MPPSAATATSTSSVLPSESRASALQRRHLNAAAQVDPVIALHLRRDAADRRAQCPGQGSRAPLDDGHGSVQVAAGGGDLAAGEPGADDQHPAGAGGQRLPQPFRIAGCMDCEHPAEPGLCLIRPGPGPGSGSDKQPVEPYLLAVGQQHLVSVQVKPVGRDAQPPVRVDVVVARQFRFPRRSLADEDLLGQRRPVVGGIRFVPDHGQGAGEALPAQHRAGPKAGQGRPDDDNAPGAPESLRRASGGRLRHGAGPLPVVFPARPARRLESDGLHRARRRSPHDLRTLRVIRRGVVKQRLVILDGEHIRRCERALRIPLAAREVDHDLHEDLPPHGEPAQSV
jgi:hypothetical protein